MSNIVQVAIPHLIGTVSLFFLLLMTGTYYQNVYATLEKEVVTFKLQEIANRVSSNIVDLVSLCFLSEADQNLTKRLELPAGVNNHLYTVNIDTYTDFALDETFYVIRAYLTFKPSMYGQSELPWLAGGFLTVDAEASTVSDGSGTVVINCQKTGDTITISLLSG